MDFKLNKNNLNFKVYTATSLPSTAQENDICVISDAPMKNWILSPDAPSGAPRTDGDVWIQYSVTGNTFNALKTGAMMVAGISAKQYVSGSWVNKEAKSYQGGEWVDWFSGTIYHNGKENVVMTANGYYYANPQATRGIVAAQKNTNHILLIGQINNAVMLGTDEPVSLANFSTLYVRGKSTGFADNGLSIGACILESKGFNDNMPVAKVDFANTGVEQTMSISLTGLDGEYYIAVFAHFSYVCAGEVYEIWLE